MNEEASEERAIESSCGDTPFCFQLGVESIDDAIRQPLPMVLLATILGLAE